MKRLIEDIKEETRVFEKDEGRGPKANRDCVLIVVIVMGSGFFQVWEERNV
jgi:hypothetical protein